MAYRVNIKSGALRHAFLLSFAICSTTMPLAAQESTFPYPAIPQELKTPQERGSYLLAHYWDDLNFADTTLIHKPYITEQGFANFIDLLPRIGSEAAERGVEAFADRAFGEGTPDSVRDYFAKLAECYLYDPDSPLRSDKFYMLFLKRMATSTAFSPAERGRFAFHLRNLEKNRPGNIATDFAYVDRHGRRRTLHDTEGELTMLYFYDPDCEHCHETTAVLAKDSLIADDPRLTVLAVYPNADAELWRRKPQPFPERWIDAYSPDGEVGAGLYFIRTTPTIFLLDRNKRVILKEPSPQELMQFLHKTG